MIKPLWDKCAKYPAGAKLFSWLLSRKIPYTGTICPDVLEVREGYAKVALHDRRGVRNHLRSLHAVALMNAAELTSGLATDSWLTPNERMILVGFQINYLKKARGTITAEANCPKPNTSQTTNHPVSVRLVDREGSEVCNATATWRISPVESSKGR